MKKIKTSKNLREDLEELLDRKSYLYDENRPEAVAKRRKKNQRTARENIADLCSHFKELGSLIVAAQKGRSCFCGQVCSWVAR